MTKRKLKQPKLTGGMSVHRNNLVNLLLRTLLLAVMVCGAGNVAWGIGLSKEINLPASATSGQGSWDAETKTLSWTLGHSNAIDVAAEQDLSGYMGITVDSYNLTAGESFRIILESGGNSYQYVMNTAGVHQILFSDFKIDNTETAISSEELKTAKIQMAGRYGNSNQGSVKINRLGLIMVKWWDDDRKVTISDPNDFTDFGTSHSGKSFTFSDSWHEARIFLDGSNANEIGSVTLNTSDNTKVKIDGFMSGTRDNGGQWYSTLEDAKAANAKITELDISVTELGSYTIESVVFNQPYEVVYSTSVDVPEGCEWWYTVGNDETKIQETRKFAEGTKITFHATDTGNDTKIINGWRDKGTSGEEGWKVYGATYTVGSIAENLNIVPEFQNCLRVFVAAEAGGTAEVSGGNGKKYFNSASPTFTATPADGYVFDGWYNSQGTKIANNTPYTASLSGTGDQTFTAKFKKNVKTIGKPECNHYGTRTHGDNYFNIQQLNPAEGVTLGEYSSETGRTVTVPTTGGSMSYFFDNEYNFGDLKSWTISENTDLQARINSIEYLDADGKQLAICYTNAGNRTLQDNENDNNLRKQLDKVKEIRINFKGNSDKYSVAAPIDYTFKWIRFTFEHADRVKPVLSEGTAKDMRVFTGENLILANGSGFWRQYTDNTYNKVKSDGFIPTNEWVKRYVITSDRLKKDEDYYFRVVDSSPCALGYTHSSEAVDVHVKVTDPINTVEVNGQTRQYDVYVPQGVTGTVGVIFSLHGASNDYWNGRVDFNAIADEQKTVENKKFIVVYPRGLMRQLRGQERGWETYTESNTEDVEFFKAIVTELKKTYTVDDKRIYLAGFSNGGMMAYKAAHQAADFFAAFASVGGYPVNESHLFHAGKQPTPFIHIQGKADGIFPNSTYPLDVITHNMVYRNGAKFNPWTEDTYEKQDGEMVTSPKDGEENDIIDKDCHAALPGGAAFYMYKVAGMGHTWTYDWDGDHVDDVAATMWKFFNKDGIKNSIDQTLKFRINDSGFWSRASDFGFDNVNTGTSVLSYGGRRKTGSGSGSYDKDTNNNNIWHSLQFQGGINGAAHFLKLNVYTENVGGASNENKSNFFLVKLTRIDPDNNKDKEVVIFSKRYQAGRGQKGLYINFAALPGFNEYKLEITKSNESFAVQINGMEVHTGKCQDVAQTENPTAFEDVATVLAGMNPIYQPVFENSYRGIAKEYLPIADIPVGSHSYTYHDNTITYKTVEDNLKTNSDTPLESLPSTMIASTGWTTNDGVTTATITNKTFFSLAKSGKTDEKTSHKSKNAVVLSDGTYTVDRTKGINISQLGRAEMPEYLNGTRLTFPTHGVIAIKVQGTVDFTLLAQNDITYPGDDADKGRSTLKVYYTNDQMAGELKELKEWWFYGVRTEVNVDDKKAYTDHPNGNNMNPLSVNVRLPQLGMDGTCTLFITYEGRRNNDYTFTHPDATDPKVYDGVDDRDKIWIKGFVIKRPDLKVTIGRTDSKYAGQNRGDEENTKLTRFGENKPYIWSFENVGFNNTKNENLNDKKVNVEDSRTYVCGGTDDSMDHLLLYSDITKIIDPETGVLILDNKVQFDGSLAGQEHIEFRKPSQYLMKDNPADASNGRLEFNPITSNGLKVNVTGSGWFKIKCSAPNGKVKMKVFSSTNYGITYTNLLREFIVDNSKHPASATGEEEHRWGEYTVYLKGHVELKKTEGTQEGFWDGDVIRYDEDKVKDAEEKVRMSLYVVFDKLNDETYTEDHKGAVSATPQLNIHQLSWLNEEPADYVFQREEDPKLLTEWQAIRRDGDGNKTLDDSSDANVVLYWKAGNDDDANYTVLKGHANGSYNVINQVNTDDAAKGVKSPGGYASTSVPSDAGTYDAYWDIAAPARVYALVEKAYGDNAKNTDTQYAYSSGNNTEFDTPVSGSFIRISAMKNTYVVAHVIPGNTSVSSNATPYSGATVYVLDETGNPIPSSSSDADASRLGYIAAMVNGGSAQYGGVASQDKTIRIDFVANAGKEYFICANGASISLARLEVHNWRNWTHKPTKAETLELTDNADNSSKIETAYETGNYYRDATLKRTFAAGKWASLVLPFSLNEQKFKEVFGENAKCIHFTDVDTENNIVKLTHHYYNMIVAGRPVFIYTPEQVVDPQFNDITLQTNVVKNTTTTSGFTFHASYDGTQMKWNDLYMNNANAIKYVSNDKSKQLTYPGMRSFIKSPNDYDPSDGRAGSAGAKAVFLSFLDDDYQDIPTGIEELISAELGEDVVVVTKTTKIYDLLGNVMGEGSDINSLPAGIYIVNGKKYIVK